MVDASRIKEHATVLGSDGVHVGTVDRVENGRIKLTRTDPDAGGQHHYVPLDRVYAIDGNQIQLDRSADEVMRAWTTSP